MARTREERQARERRECGDMVEGAGVPRVVTGPEVKNWFSLLAMHLFSSGPILF